MSDALTALLDRVADAASKATPGRLHAAYRGIGWELHRGERPPAGCWKGGPDCCVVNDEYKDTFVEGDAQLFANCDPELVSALVAVVREAIRCEAQTHSGEKPRAIGDCEGPPCKSLDALRALAESRARKEQP
jgi:hypothetical protein